tara:strand:- start:10057 stop:10662 length:606 start_codon:yes stop_codon:yes gene_type:complete
MISIILYYLFELNKKNEKLEKLEKVLNSMDLSTKWLPGYNVDCLTGERVKEKSTTVSSSHCSCFVFAVCKKMNIKMIGTPEYKQYHLSTNQMRWLKTDDAKKSGWNEINGSLNEKYLMSQKKANNGYLVIAGVEQDNEIRGHIAIVRPSNKMDFYVKNEGPEVMSSSTINTVSSSLRDDFLYYQKDMKDFENRTKFYYNEN